ncbi:lipopolysaccharide heptosyltransferase family protein [candidate division KSB1 bacterium]|nr:glycosyltransferase family 9 protein [candidate division KSB1 bacterium]RQW03109.1 MAG: lipopolysaccharide heptosyltransferase family protein [candidate division KSB1 bacterium]
MKALTRILLSRTDSIGDVVLTLPMAGLLRQLRPKAEILFLGQAYTQPVIHACEHVAEFWNWDDVKTSSPREQAEWLKSTRAEMIIHVFPRRDIARAAQRARIPLRCGTTNRLYHWWTCNKHVRLSRKNSPEHEAQLNLKLLGPLGAKSLYTCKEIARLYGLTRPQPLQPEFAGTLSANRFNLIIHPTSKGSAQEWGLNNFVELIKLLPRERFCIFITGTESDGQEIRHHLQRDVPFVHDLTGKMNLAELISFIASADGLLANSTGPLHLAAALGKYAIGLYPSRSPMHPGRWAPLGKKADVIQDGITNAYPGNLKIEPTSVLKKLQSLL